MTDQGNAIKVYWDSLQQGKTVHLLGRRPRLGWPSGGKIALCGSEIEATQPNDWARIGLTPTSKINCAGCRREHGLGQWGGTSVYEPPVRTLWMPHGWRITTNDQRGHGQWQYEATADGIEWIKGPPPGNPAYGTPKEAQKWAREALRHRALNLMTTGWSPSSGMAHGMIYEKYVAICNKTIEVEAYPDLSSKESPKCKRCLRILEQLEAAFPEDEC